MTTWGPKAKLRIVTALAETGRTAAGDGADVGIPLMLMLALGRAVDSTDGVPVFPEKPAGFAPLNAVSNMPTAAAAAAMARRQQWLARGKWIIMTESLSSWLGTGSGIGPSVAGHSVP